MTPFVGTDDDLYAKTWLITEDLTDYFHWTSPRFVESVLRV